MIDNTGTDTLYTGRRVVVLRQPAGGAAQTLRTVAGISDIAHTGDFAREALEVAAVSSAGAVVFDNLGIAVVDADSDQSAALESAAAGDEIVSVEPELIHHALTATLGTSADYARGYRDGIADFSSRLATTDGSAADTAAASATFADTDRLTWGLQAVRADSCPHTGHGVRVAVLDTGFDLHHPDFAGRPITAQSFVAGETPQDGHGHGTHCIGTASGPADPPGTRRYGLATEAEIFVGKVLNDQGRGTDTGILAGINWAIANNCVIVSMSLGANVRTVSQAYEHTGRRALDRGTLIIAAAGNNAARPGDPGFVGVPANSPSIMAVAAVDSRMAVAKFSAASNPVDGGQIDIAAPGVSVFSSWPSPLGHRSINGTSMATPHVSGCAALWQQATGHLGRDLWALIVQNAARLPLSSIDIGAGLVQAPQ